jgi:uncharacterized protein (DUF2384 family)
MSATRGSLERSGAGKKPKIKGPAASRSHAEIVRGAKIVAKFIDPQGVLRVGNVAEWFGMSRGQLAETVGVSPETLQRAKRVAAPKTQIRVKEMLEIVGRVADWAGGKDQAMAWYRAEPIPAFGGRTAESLVKEGKAAAVRDFLDHVAVGGFA